MVSFEAHYLCHPTQPNTPRSFVDPEEFLTGAVSHITEVSFCLHGLASGLRMNFTTKKRARKDAWRELQKDLDDREQLEEENTVKFTRMDALRGRTAIGVESSPQNP